MNLINRKKDNIIPIVKSLRPIKDLYSKQNKDYDKYFHGSCLKDFVKQINSQKKADYILDPGENINEYDDKNKDSGIDFKNALNYFRELSKLKKLPFSKLNKVIIKSKRYNSEENKKNKKKKNKSNKLNKRRRKIINLVKIKNNADADITLDPGKYNPNYNYIKRRYPCAFFGKVKKDDNSLSQSKLDNSEEKDNENDKKDNKDLNKDKEEKKVDSKNNKNDNKKIDKNKKKLFISFSNKDTNFKDKKNDTKDKQIKFKLIKNKNKKNEENEKNKKDPNQKLKYINGRKQETVNSSLKDATVSSWYNTNEFDKNKKMKKSRTQFYGTQTMFRNNKIRFMDKLSSEDNVKCTVMFDKMQGREKPTNFSQGKKEALRVSYNPNYNFIMPHVPTTIFKSQRKYEEIKKYMTNKIIRSYRYNSENYFVFLYNKKIEDKKEEKREQILLN